MAITSLPDGRWKVDIEPVKGRRFRKTFKAKADAKRFELVCRQKVIQDPEWSPRTKDQRKLSELVALWYDLHGHTLRDGERRKRALLCMASRLKDPVAAKLTPSAYMIDRRKRSDSSIADKTLNNELTYIRAVYNELYALDQVKYENPLSKVKPLKLQQRELSWLTQDQIRELLEVIRSRSAGANPHLELIVLVCLATGARWSEAQNLKPTSVRNRAVTFSNTKNGKVRTVPISQDLEQRLQEHWKVYGPFTSSIGAFRRALEKTTIELPKGQAAHVLRHSFASHFMMNGGNILTLQKILGHSAVTVTMRYAHLSPDHLQESLRFSPLSFL
ncbi:site-specific recombinase XerD [Marinobacterium halophilum]|uniref:Site-specific recombinase XerD n=1 Tax=Marinobacterium halophilum TaxID=267374 RepID=A0A2P8ET56_9GAMM|nr:tyrosine-type recombinase/integrase [Marinobacterium halophilum]PSL12660.1 site-specific recombinase XerD [Marinobacterium halophilum]